MISENGDNLIFQLGIPRSGTTLLSVMLNNHPQVRCPPEPWLMLALHALGRSSARDPADSPVLYRAYHQFCDRAGTKTDAAAYAVRAYNRCLQSTGKQILVDKTPRYYLILDYLLELFPGARFIVLWRNPLDAALSMKSTWNFDVPALLAARQDHPACIDLALGLRRLADFQRAHANICHTLHYEQLVRDPHASLDALLDWAGLPRNESLDHFNLADTEYSRSEWGDKKVLETQSPHQNSVGKWKSAFSTDEQRVLIDAIGPELLAEIGYDEVLSHAAAVGIDLSAARGAASYARDLQAALDNRIAEYDNASTYSDLSVHERRLQEALRMTGAGSDAQAMTNLNFAMQTYAARAEANRIEAENGRSLQIAYQARMEEGRQSLHAVSEQLARSNADWASRLAAVDAALKAAQTEADAALKTSRTCADAAMKAAQTDADAALKAAQTEADAALKAAQADADAALSAAKSESAAALEEAARAAASQIESLQQQSAAERETARHEFQNKLAETEQRMVAQFTARLEEARRQYADLENGWQARWALAAAENRTELAAERDTFERTLAKVKADGESHRQARIELDWQLAQERESLAHVRGLLSEVEGEVEELVRLESQQNSSGMEIAERLHLRGAAETQLRAAHERIRVLDDRLGSLLRSRWRRASWKLGAAPPAWRDEAPGAAPELRETSTARSDQELLDETMSLTSRMGAAIRALSLKVKSAAVPQKDEMETAIEHLIEKNFNPRVVFDLGAAKGYWTDRFAWRWKEAEFFMIDPLDESEPFLKAMTDRESRFHYILAAVGREPGFFMMNITKDHDGSSLLSDGKTPANPARQRRVPVETVDGLLAAGKLKAPDLVKLDVQGFELNVMDGGQRMFDTAEVFIIEVNLYSFTDGCPRVHEIVRYMADRGFYLFDLAGTLRRPFENDLGQMDLVFVSEKSSLGSSNRWA